MSGKLRLAYQWLRQVMSIWELINSLRVAISAGYQVMYSDVPALAWPESPGFGLALGGLGLRKS